ncbi:MAG: hypothetical protein ACK47S_17365 [Paracoccaceae bacterium]
MERVRAHRLEEAAKGFPLLRGCPSTFVLRRLAALDGLTERDRVAYADQLSDYAAADPSFLTAPDRAALMARLPLVAAVEAEGQSRPDLRFQNVKNLARLVAEPGGIEGFIRLQGLTGEAAGPPAPNVPSFAEAVPVAPAKLRKAIAGALEGRFGGKVAKQSSDLEQLRVEVPRGRMVLNLSFAGKGWGAMSRQFDYSLWADLDGVRMVPTSYEAIWLLPAQWDLLTPSNVEAAATHLVRLVETRLALEG